MTLLIAAAFALLMRAMLEIVDRAYHCFGVMLISHTSTARWYTPTPVLLCQGCIYVCRPLGIFANTCVDTAAVQAASSRFVQYIVQKQLFCCRCKVLRA